jgi:hypothetical protein
VVDVDTEAETFIYGTPQPLFPVATNVTLQTSSYDVTADGERFIVNSSAVDNQPVTWILNWAAEQEP